METKDMKTVLRERAIHNYIRALDLGNSAIVEQVLKMAEMDDLLAQTITEIDQVYAEEMGLSSEHDVENVLRLLQRHFPDSLDDKVNARSLTVGEVVAQLKAKKSILIGDQMAAEILLKSSKELPQNLSSAEVKKLSLEFGVHISDAFWRDFRKSAITLSMGQDSENQSMLAAAREKKSTKAKRDMKDE